MNEIIFNTKEYTSKNETYKDFYRDIYSQFNGKNILDFEDYENLHYNADLLNEFLWYVSVENFRLVFIELDIEKIKKQKTVDDYEWYLILGIVRDFVREYPNNTLEFRNE